MAKPSIRDFRAELSRQQQRQRSRPRRRTWLLGALALLIVALVAGRLALPGFVRGQLQARLTAALGREVVVNRVDVQLMRLAVAVEGFSVRETDGSTLLGWKRLYVNVQARSAFGGALAFDAVELDDPELNLVLAADGRLNLDAVLSKLTTPAAGTVNGNDPKPTARSEEPARALYFGHLAVTGAQVTFVDHTRGEQAFKTTLGPLDFGVDGLHTGGAADAPYHFSGRTEAGETFAWEGDIRLNPVRSKGHLLVDRLQLNKYRPYYAAFLHGSIDAGTVSLDTHYELDLSPGATIAHTTGGTLSLADMRITGAAGPVIELPAMRLDALDTDAFTHAVHAEKLAFTGGTLHLMRPTQGPLNVAALFTAPASSPATATAKQPSPAPAPAPSIVLDALEAANFTVDFHDASTTRPVETTLVLDSLKIGRVDATHMGEVPLAMRAHIASDGMLDLQGLVQPDTAAARLQLKLTGLPLATFDPYLDPFVAAHVTRGALDVDGTLTIPPASRGIPVAPEFAGWVALHDLATTTADATHAPLLGIEQLTMQGIKFAGPTATTALSLDIASITLTAPELDAVILPDGSPSLAHLVRDDGGAKTTSPKPAASPGPVPDIRIGHTTLTGGALHFSDRSIGPPVALAVTDIGLDVGTLASRDAGTASLELSATIGTGGSLEVAGSLNPLSATASTNLHARGRGIDLRPLSPYVGKYAGYLLDDGSLALDLDYHVQDRRLQLANLVDMQDFTFGAATTSPDATKLPVRLAVAILKDRSGLIHLDLPVEGNLDDPSFRVGRVVLRAFTNVLTKVATAPFALLGSAFGGDQGTAPADLSTQPFDPGSAEPNQTATGRLDSLAKALDEHPALRIELTGAYDPETDRAVLQRDALTKAARQALWESRRMRNVLIPPPDQMPFGPDDYADGLKALYAREFPEEISALAAKGMVQVTGPAGVKATNATPPANLRTTPGANATSQQASHPPAPVRFLQALFGGGNSSGSQPAKPAAPAKPMAAPGTDVAMIQLAPKELEARLTPRFPVPDSALAALATQRAEAVQAGLVARGVAAERVSIAAQADSSSAGKAVVRAALR